MKKYLLVRFDNDFTIPIQQTFFCIKQALNYKIRSSYCSTKKLNEDISLKTLDQAVRHYGSIFSNLFGLTIHGNLDTESKSEEWFSKNVIMEIEFGTEDELMSTYADLGFKSFFELAEDFRDGGEWLTIEYDEGGRPIKVEGGVNYITDDYL